MWDLKVNGSSIFNKNAIVGNHWDTWGDKTIFGNYFHSGIECMMIKDSPCAIVGGNSFIRQLYIENIFGIAKSKLCCQH